MSRRDKRAKAHAKKKKNAGETKRNRMQKEPKKKELLNELRFLLALDHPRILRAHGMYELTVQR